jgi:hypothetical protein
MSVRAPVLTVVVAALACCVASVPAHAQCPAAVPAIGAIVPAPLPVFPPTNWWNLDISTAPVDPSSSAYIAFVNNGGTRKLHPDFGGEAARGSVDTYGMPYAIVDGTQPKLPVTFDYWDESDGVDYSTRRGVPFYPIPVQAITQAHWVEGGAPGNVDQRADADRHLLLIDCTNRYLYELYNVWYDTAQGQWHAGSGAFFDLNANGRRPDTWTSADAAGLAIFPGLVRYDEAWDPAVTDIGHAFRVTVRSTNGYVWPASHRAGSTPGALPMGARLRLKASVNGTDPALRTGNANVRKIFRAMQKYGLIVADNGSDMYITGTFDTRWDNGILNPAFALLSASDFEVVALGWKPPAAPLPAFGAISADPDAIIGPGSSIGTVTLTSVAPTGGALVSLTSASAVVTVPASVTVAGGASAATFAIAAALVSQKTATTISASYNGATKTINFLVSPNVQLPAVLTTLALERTSVTGGSSVTGTVTLAAPAPAAGAVVALKSSNAGAAAVPASVTIAAGTTSKSFVVTTSATRRTRSMTITATYAGVSKAITLTATQAGAGTPRGAVAID